MLRLTHLLKEVEEPNHDFDRDMVVGVAEILRMVDDIDNREEIADRMMDKFDDEDVNYDAEEFMSMSGLVPVNEAETPQAPKDTGDKIKNLQLRIKIMKDTLKLPKSSQSKSKLQRRIVKANKRLADLKREK